MAQRVGMNNLIQEAERLLRKCWLLKRKPAPMYNRSGLFELLLVIQTE